MIPLIDRFPDKHKLITVYLRDGTNFIGSVRSGGSGISSIEGEDTDHYFCNDELEEKYHYDKILGWEYYNDIQ